METDIKNKNLIYHIANKDEWTKFKDYDYYVPKEYEHEGFIHNSESHQLKLIFAKKFNNILDGTVILEIDPTKLSSQVVYENLSGGKEKYPHIYGVINKEAIKRILPHEQLRMMTNINETESRTLFNSRLINASRHKIFSAFSNPKHLQNWWGPDGFSNTFSDFNFCENGKWEFVMHGPDGKDYLNKSVFREIMKPSKIVIEHVNAPHFILTITLNEEEDKTRMNWSMLFESVELRDNLAKLVADANEQNFNRLEKELSLIK